MECGIDTRHIYVYYQRSTQTNTMTPEQIATEIAPDYLATRVLPDGSVAAVGDLLFTRAIHLGCSRTGFASRFCFEDRALAMQRFYELTSEDDEPQGYIARR